MKRQQEEERVREARRNEILATLRRLKEEAGDTVREAGEKFGEKLKDAGEKVKDAFKKE